MMTQLLESIEFESSKVICLEASVCRVSHPVDTWAAWDVLPGNRSRCSEGHPPPSSLTVRLCVNYNSPSYGGK